MMENASVEKSDLLLVFALDDRRYALHVEAVERVLLAVEVTPLADAPHCILGIINMKGRIIPVVDLRKRFFLPERELHPVDRFIIAKTPRRTLALRADGVHGVSECPAEAVVPAEEILPRTGPVEGVMCLADGLLLISDIDRFLSLEEETVLAGLVKDLAPDMVCGEEAP